MATESWFHSAGDGMGRLAGLLDPADDKCHLKENLYKRGDVADYPSIKQVVDKLAENSIIPIFAVRQEQLDLYRNATDQLFRGGTVEVLEKNSENILELIENAYTRITQKQHLMLSTSESLHPDALCLGSDGRFTDADGINHTFAHGEDITGLNSKSVVSYTLRESVHRDAACGVAGDQTVAEGDVVVRTQRYEDTLMIKTAIQCDFDCMASIVLSSAKCSGKGDFACGVCLCPANFFGKNCEFKTPNCPVPGVNCNDCINPFQPTKICSGNGACPNGHCICNTIPGGEITGKWCECSTEDCFNDGSDGTQRGICSMHGKCACPPPLGIEGPTYQMGEGISQCVCDDGYNNDKCQCPSSQATCISNGEICSGKGECVCGKCKCHDADSWTGFHCEVPNCAGTKCASCMAYLDCVKCLYHGEQPANVTCDRMCVDAATTYKDVEKGSLVDETPSDDASDYGRLCSGLACPKDDPDCGSKCKFYYKYADLGNGKVKIWAEDGAHCRVQYSLIIILFAVLIALLVGLLFLCCWRICVFCVDREKRFPTIAYLVEFIKAKYFVKRSQSVAVVPVRRSVFDGALKCKWRTFPGHVADDDFKVIREGESGGIHSTLLKENEGVIPATIGKPSHSIEMERLINNAEINWGQGYVEWKEGEEFANIIINVKGQDFEGREAAFWVELIEAPTEIHFGRKRSKIIVIKDDEPGSIGFAKPSYVFKEADHSALIPVHRANGTDGKVKVNYTSRDMTAIAGQHYRQAGGMIEFADGETSRLIEIDFYQDTIFDGREKAFNLELSNPQGGCTLDTEKCLVTLLFDETVSVVQFLRPSYPFLENCQNAAVPVIRTRSTKGRSTVWYRTRDITAKAGVDYKASEGELEFCNGETEKTIEVPIIENQCYIEEGRTFGLDLFDPSDGTKMELNACEIKIIEDDDPGRFEFARPNYTFKSGTQTARIPVIRSMGADGLVAVPWRLTSANSDPLPDKLAEQATQQVEFENMAIDGEIVLDVNIDKKEDTICSIELLQPTNNARLGQEKLARVQILGKGHFDEVAMNIPLNVIQRGNKQSPVIVNITRTIRVNPPQAAVVLFETVDGTALAARDDYTAVKKAIIFDANETEKQVKIHVNDDDDDEISDDLEFSCNIIPVSDRVLITEGAAEATVYIEQAMMFTKQGVTKSAAGDYHRSKISFALGEYLCRLSEKTVKIEIKRIRKMNKKVTCKMTSQVAQGQVHPNTGDLDTGEIVFEPEMKSLEIDFKLPLVMSDQLVVKLTLFDFGINASAGSVPECDITIINDKHAGVVGFSVPEMTFPVSEKHQQIGLIRAGGTDGDVSVTVTALDGTAENGVQFLLDDETVVKFNDGQYQAELPIEFLPGNHGKMVSRKCVLRITTVNGMGRIGQRDCTLQLLTDQAPCSVSFARPEFSFMAGSGDQGLPLLRIGALENAAQIAWSIRDHPENLEGRSFPTEGLIDFAVSANRAMLKVPSELLSLSINKKFKIEIERLEHQMAVNLGKYHSSTIRVVSGEEPGSFEFRKTRAVCRQNDGKIDLPIVRQGGSDGVVVVSWRSASELESYTGLFGDLVFAEGVYEQILTIEIDEKMASETDIFNILLVSASNGTIGPRNSANVSILKETEEIEFEFETDYLTTAIGAIDAEIDIIVKGELDDMVSLRYATQPDTAIPGEHYLTKSEQVIFKPGDTRKTIHIGLLEAPLEDPVSLTVSLLVATGPGLIGPRDSCLVNIPPAGHPGMVSFTKDFIEVNQSEKIVQLPLTRARGNRGALSVSWTVEADNWYDGAAGQILFANGQSSTLIDFPLRAQPCDDGIHEFTVVIRKPGGKAELGPVPRLTIRVHNDVAGGRVQFMASSSEVVTVEGDTSSTVMIVSDGKNRVPFELEYQLLPILTEARVESELASAFANTITIPAGVQQIPLEIPVQYIPSGTTQQVLIKLLKTNRGVRIGAMDAHTLTALSPKRTVGFIEKAVRIQQSKHELVLIVKRKRSTKEAVLVPWIAYTKPEPLSGMMKFEDQQEFEEIRIPFRQVYISDLALVEEFEVEIKPGTIYEIEDGRNKCHVTLDNDLGPGVIEFEDTEVKQTQSNGNLVIRLNRLERHLEEATVKWRIAAQPGSPFIGQVGTVQFESGDEHLDLVINVPDIPQDNPEEHFQIVLDQPINASLGGKTKCDVTLVNDKSM